MKRLLSANEESAHSRLGTHVFDDNHEVLDNFVYLVTSINTNNDVSLETHNSISLANRYDEQRLVELFCSSFPSYLIYDVEAWTKTPSDVSIKSLLSRKDLARDL